MEVSRRSLPDGLLSRFKKTNLIRCPAYRADALFAHASGRSLTIFKTLTLSPVSCITTRSTKEKRNDVGTWAQKPFEVVTIPVLLNC
jgi:hypothetical protein